MPTDAALLLAPPPPAADVPAAYAPLRLADEPVFDPAAHLALGEPAQVLRLADLGYRPGSDTDASSDLAVAGPFTLLSAEGLVAARQVCLALQGNAMAGDDDRAPSYVPGAGYRSRFLHDLAHDATVLAHVSALAGVPLAPHALPDGQAYVNYAPADVSKHVDSWHVDSIAYDMVVMLSDPAGLHGGELEFALVDRASAARTFGTDVHRLHLGYPQELPDQQVVAVPFERAGTAVVQQGTHVVHRAARLTRPGERITLVLGYTPLRRTGPDVTNVEYVATWPHPGIAGELARQAAWLGGERLAALVADLPVDVGPAQAAAALRAAVAEVARTAAALEAVAATG